MIIIVLVEILILILLLALSAFFSSSETALFSLSEIQVSRIRKENEKAGEAIHDLTSRPTRLLSAILIGNTLVNVSASIVGYLLAVRFYPHHGELISVVVMTLLLLVFGEIGPKRVSMFWPDTMAILYAPLLQTIVHVLTPLRSMLEVITHSFEHVFHMRSQALTEEEFQTVVSLGAEKGILDEEETAMVHSIIRLEDLQASDVMTPRVDIIGIDLNDMPKNLLEFVNAVRVRKLVLYRDQLDHIEGTLDVRQFLLDPSHDFKAIRREPFYVPETTSLDKLLRQLIEENRRTAIVVDEYGGTAGVVTRGDILEEITGEIDDEHAEHKPLLEHLGPNRWLADGQASIEDINARLNTSLKADGSDRISGWVTEKMEHLPHSGECIEAQGVKVTVQKMRRNRITLVLIELTGNSSGD
ncbi:MAG: hemolysin family protein [Verrucomicrobia bacterium]|nr:hemolysin family protein [Verrucomicrobiota bacterium]